jgi:phosphopantetheinyl transferase (holo-ACP synthase)
MLVSRWAAKEAIIKASNRKLFMRDIIIYRDAANKNTPFGIILDKTPDDTSNTSDESPRTAKTAGESNPRGSTVSTGLPYELTDIALDGQIVPVSISHDKDYAVATALVPSS